MDINLLSSKREKAAFPLPGIVVALSIVAVTTFVVLTPPGFLSKLDAVGYAVCHRIPSHSFVIGGHQLPLCARCTGTFTGALVGFLGQMFLLRRKRASEFPPPSVLAILVTFILLMGVDGLNSYLTLLPQISSLYPPRNWLRLVTGTLNGVAISTLLYPIINLTLWLEPANKRAVARFKDLTILLLPESALIASVLWGRPVLLYPLALFSALGVLTLFTLVNMVILVMLAGQENRFSTWREAAIPLLGGFTLSVVEIGLIDFLRYTLTGTWQGLPHLQ